MHAEHREPAHLSISRQRGLIAKPPPRHESVLAHRFEQLGRHAGERLPGRNQVALTEGNRLGSAELSHAT